MFIQFFGYNNFAVANSSPNVTYEIGENTSVKTFTLPFTLYNLKVEKSSNPTIYLNTKVPEIL